MISGKSLIFRWNDLAKYPDSTLTKAVRLVNLTNFDDICDYLNLPSIFESIVMENQSESDCYSDENDDDFNVYGEEDNE